MPGLSYGSGPELYGSAWHLLRFLGYHRELLNRRICSSTGLSAVRWLDLRFDGNNGDQELTGIEFLLDGNVREKEAAQRWKDIWPQRGTQHHWDTVGRAIAGDGSTEWVMVEAKANVEELHSSCGATSARSKEMISDAIKDTAGSLGITDTDSWLSEYYQYAKRLVFLHSLLRSGVNASLVYIYFCGDRRPDNVFCPASEKEWRPVLRRQYSHMGLPDDGRGIMGRVHDVFFGVRGS